MQLFRSVWDLVGQLYAADLPQISARMDRANRQFTVQLARFHEAAVVRLLAA